VGKDQNSFTRCILFLLNRFLKITFKKFHFYFFPKYFTSNLDVAGKHEGGLSGNGKKQTKEKRLLESSDVIFRWNDGQLDNVVAQVGPPSSDLFFLFRFLSVAMWP
jgi:hypothetical protein